jgi:hypothetical protein
MRREFWAGCGYQLLERTVERRLAVTDAYLRTYFERPELMPVAESCAAERRLHGKLLATPRAQVEEAEIGAVADEDARENYRVMLRFRAQLLAAPTLEAFYCDLILREVSVPPVFVHHIVQAIVRGLLEDAGDGLQARAGELFFRSQRVTVREGAVMLADDATVERHAQQSDFGSVGRLLKELGAPLAHVELDVLDERNAARYFERDERYDTVLAIHPGGAGSAALCRVLERWIGHFHGVDVTITAVPQIPDEEWLWHVGLDAEATALLNAVYNGEELDNERMKRIIGLFRADFADPHALRPELHGAPVFLGLAMTPAGMLRMKPQNLLVNLPLARRA